MKLCKIGWHSWQKWGEPFKSKMADYDKFWKEFRDPYITLCQKRECLKCGKVQIQKVDGVGDR